jgi:hypothetical protein
MANVGGAVRVIKTGKFIIVVGVFFLCVGILQYAIWRIAWPSEPMMKMIPFMPSFTGFGPLLVIFGALLWLTGWIAEGFLAPRGSE